MIRKPSRPHLRLLPCLALLLLVAAGLAACGPEPAEIDRSPVAGMTEADPDDAVFTGDTAEGPRNEGTLTLTGTVTADGAVEVDCGPTRESHGSEGDAARVPFRVAMLPVEGEGRELVLRIDDFHGEGRYEAALSLQVVDPEGTYLESSGTARVEMEDGAQLASDSATHFATGRFEGEYDGAAGRGTAAGSFERCYFFE
ncbi:MAG TPA: hypothetical protein VHQ65_10115 [Thermoanaerobaculia bacterium]|nr:hypothetical protein [Thermoanaerobaculia bacterium]